MSKPIRIDANILQRVKDDLDNLTSKSLRTSEFSSGPFGLGWELYFDKDTGFTNLEVDNISVRNTLKASIFQKEVIRATNGRLYISDSGIISSIDTSGKLIGFDNKKSASFSSGQKVTIKDINTTGSTIASTVIITIGTVSSSTSEETIYNYTLDSGTESEIEVGMTGVRTSGPTILLDTNDTHAPFIDLYENTEVVEMPKVRIGNLSGIDDADLGSLSGYGLYSENVYLKGTIKANDGEIGGWKVDTNLLSSGNIELDSTDGQEKISITGTNNSIIFNQDGSAVIGNLTINSNGSINENTDNFYIEENGSAYFSGTLTGSSGLLGDQSSNTNYIVELGDTISPLIIRDTQTTPNTVVKFNSDGSFSLGNGDIIWDSNNGLDIDGSGTFSGTITAAAGSQIGGLYIGANFIGSNGVNSTWGNTNTGFYLGSNGDFSLEEKLTWDASTQKLSINGDLTASFSEGLTFDSDRLGWLNSNETSWNSATSSIKEIGSLTYRIQEDLEDSGIIYYKYPSSINFEYNDTNYTWIRLFDSNTNAEYQNYDPLGLGSITEYTKRFPVYNYSSITKYDNTVRPNAGTWDPLTKQPGAIIETRDFNGNDSVFYFWNEVNYNYEHYTTYADTRSLTDVLNDIERELKETEANLQLLNEASFGTLTLAPVAASGSFNDLVDVPTTLSGYGITDNIALISDIPTNNNELTNGAGYITDYTVTQGDVTAHQAALSLTMSQISDSTWISDYTVTQGDVTAHQAALIISESQISDLANYALVSQLPTNNNELTNGAGYITGYTVTSGDVTQHQADLSITESQISDLGNYITGNQTITLSGDVSGSGTTDIEVTVKDDSHNHIISNIDGLQTALNSKVDENTAITASTHTKITYDAKGLVTGGSTPTTLAGYSISDAMSTSHAANSIAAADITNWNTAYGWGNHAGLYRPVAWVPAWGDISGTTPTWNQNTTGNAATATLAAAATKLATARNIALTGAVTGNADFDGTGDISITTALDGLIIQQVLVDLNEVSTNVVQISTV